jgi:RHS repeat-associated protein
MPVPTDEVLSGNGRVYDPMIGRFLSPDPYVHAPDYSQNFNRYSYALNNPLIYTDPSGEIVLGLLRGLGDAIFSGGLEFWNWGDSYWKDAWAQADPFNPGTAGNNSARIWGGLFAADTKQSGWGWQIVSRFTWELPQTLMGFTGSHAANLFGNVESVEYYGGATVVQGSHDNLFWGADFAGPAITLGSYIIGDKNIKADPNNSLFQHEYGHVLQSREMGWGYLPRVGIPSIRSNLSSGYDHDFHPVEQDANMRAFNYFNKHESGFYDTNPYDGKGWNFYSNPLDPNRTGRRGIVWDYMNPAHMQVVNSLNISAKWYDHASWLFLPVGGPIWVGLINKRHYNKNY